MILYDVIIIGGSFAGISAALQLARASRKVLIVDKKSPRNRASQASHGVLGFDGVSPLEILDLSCRQLATYPSVTTKNAEAIKAENISGKFTIYTADGAKYHASKLIITSGVIDVLPIIPGLKEKWGNTVVNCPYCHGYEFKNRPTGIVLLDPEQLDMARMLLDWTENLTIFTNNLKVNEDELNDIYSKVSSIETAKIKSLEGLGDKIEGVSLEGGKIVNLDLLYLNAPVRMSNSLALDLGCEIEETKAGSYIKANEDRLTSIPGVFAAGDIASPHHSVNNAICDGSKAGKSAHKSLIFPS